MSGNGGDSRMLDLRSGGWLLLVAVALVALVVFWLVAPILTSRSHAVGDGVDVDSYGFDLGTLLVPRERIVAAGMAKGQIPALDHPPAMGVEDVAQFNAAQRGKYLVPDDRVIGVVAGDEARAYPLRMLNWHEVINDTVGGVPIAVTYHPLCASAVVFDRRVDGEELTFGVSGLLLNSNLLLYDRRENGEGESLWSQLQARAVAGPAAARGKELTVLPASLARWEHWRRLYPATTVPQPELMRLKQYQSNPYGNYYLTGRPRFPVEPLPPREGPALMEPMVVVKTGDSRRVLPLTAAALARELEAVAPSAGMSVSVDTESETPSVVVARIDDGWVAYSLWFAWYAQHPDTALAELGVEE